MSDEQTNNRHPRLSNLEDLRGFLDGSLIDTQDMMRLAGRGGASRMFARGKNSTGGSLESVDRFFCKGSTLQRAVAFTKTAVALGQSAPQGHMDRDEHPVQVGIPV